MDVHVSKRLYDDLLDYCAGQRPEEACGFIAGRKQAGRIAADTLLPVPNVSPTPRRRFAMSPEALMAKLFDSQYIIVGIFHSHPRTDAAPSSEDLASSWTALPTYWIVSFETPGSPHLSIYQIKKTPETLCRKLSFAIDQ